MPPDFGTAQPFLSPKSQPSPHLSGRGSLLLPGAPMTEGHAIHNAISKSGSIMSFRKAISKWRLDARIIKMLSHRSWYNLTFFGRQKAPRNLPRKLFFVKKSLSKRGPRLLPASWRPHARGSALSRSRTVRFRKKRVRGQPGQGTTHQ